MANKAKTTKKTTGSERDLLLASLALAAAIGLGLALFVKFHATPTATPALTVAGDTLGSIVETFRIRQGLQVGTKEMECGQNPMVFDDGPITCQVYYTLNSPNNTAHFEDTYDTLKDIITNAIGISDMKASGYRVIDNTYDTNYNIEFMVNKIKCGADGALQANNTSAKFSFMCSQVVPDFLPGYTVEK